MSYAEADETVATAMSRGDSLTAVCLMQAGTNLQQMQQGFSFYGRPHSLLKIASHPSWHPCSCSILHKAIARMQGGQIAGYFQNRA